MAVNLSPVGGVAAQFFTNTGAVLTGGKLFTYLAGTTTPAASYTSSNGSTAWTNPIVLDAAGRVPGSGEIWITDGLLYKFLLKDANDVLIATYDNISGINSNFIAFVNQQEIVTATAGQTVFNLGISYQPGTNSLSVFVDGVNQYGPGAQYAYLETDADTVTFVSGLHVGAEVKFTTSQLQNASVGDASQVTYTPPFANSVTTNVEAKLAQTVSVKDFGAVGNGIADDTAAIQTALTQSAGKTVFFPAGTYNISDLIFVGSNTTIMGYGATLFCTAASDVGTGLYITDATYLVGVENVSVYGLKIDGNRASRTPPGTGALFYISSGKNHTLVDCVAANSTIDGFQVAGDTGWAGGVNKNTRFYNCEADNSYRNGLSVVGTDNFVDYGGKYHDTNGANPEIGVDIEPNGATSRNYGFSFYGTHVYDNASHGISINGSSGTNTTGLLSSIVSTGNSGYGFQSDQSSNNVRIHAPQASNNMLGSFDPTGYAFDQDKLATRTIYSARVRKSAGQTVTSATFVDVTSTTVTYTPTYTNSATRLRIKGNYSIINSSGTIVSSTIQLINVGTSAVVDDCSPIIQVNNNGSNPLRQDGTFFLAGQENNVGVTPVSYKVQAKLNSGTQIDIGSVEVIAEEINLG
jgi:hypothetical protein